MSEIKNIKRKFWKEMVQITYKIRKVKDVYDKVLQKDTCKLQKVLNNVLKVLKTIWKILKSVRKSRTAENPHHAETSLSNHNANKLAGCSTYIHTF